MKAIMMMKTKAGIGSCCGHRWPRPESLGGETSHVVTMCVLMGECGLRSVGLAQHRNGDKERRGSHMPLLHSQVTERGCVCLSHRSRIQTLPAKSHLTRDDDQNNESLSSS